MGKHTSVPWTGRFQKSRSCLTVLPDASQFGHFGRNFKPFTFHHLTFTAYCALRTETVFVCMNKPPSTVIMYIYIGLHVDPRL